MSPDYAAIDAGGGERSAMLSWLARRRARIESIEAEAEALVCDLGEAAYSVARLARRQIADRKR